MEARHHFVRQLAGDVAFVMRAQSKADRVQAEIGAAAFVRNWKSIAADTEFLPADDGIADAAGAHDDDAAVASRMRADARDRRVVDVGNRFERMRTR